MQDEYELNECDILNDKNILKLETQEDFNEYANGIKLVLRSILNIIGKSFTLKSYSSASIYNIRLDYLF